MNSWQIVDEIVFLLLRSFVGAEASHWSQPYYWTDYEHVNYEEEHLIEAGRWLNRPNGHDLDYFTGFTYAECYWWAMLGSDWWTFQRVEANQTFDVAFLEDDLQLKLELKVDFFEIQFENRFHDEFSLVNSILHLNEILSLVPIHWVARTIIGFPWYVTVRCGRKAENKPSLFLTAWAMFGSDGEENIEFCCCPVRGTNPLGPGSRGSRWFNELIELGRRPHGGESLGFESRIEFQTFTLWVWASTDGRTVRAHGDLMAK